MEIPNGSVYFWMYEQGLKHTNLDLIMSSMISHGRQLRDKDIQNYWNGWYNALYRKRDLLDLSLPTRVPKPYKDFRPHPCSAYPDPIQVWVPCDKDNRPMIKWGNGCLSIEDAMQFKGCIYLAENMYMTKRIVIDIDGDHDEGNLDLDTIAFGSEWITKTHCIAKTTAVKEQMPDAPDYLLSKPVSFHLTFTTDKLIPTMHFPYAHIDVIGNARNSLRYYKTKEYNKLSAMPMTDDIWKSLIDYLERRRQCATDVVVPA